MIVVCVSDTEITVTGHAGQASLGHDIVCAGATILTSTLMHALIELEPECAECWMEVGNAEIKITNPSERTMLLTNAFCIGFADLMDTYPEYVRLVDCRT